MTKHADLIKNVVDAVHDVPLGAWSDILEEILLVARDGDIIKAREMWQEANASWAKGWHLVDADLQALEDAIEEDEWERRGR